MQEPVDSPRPPVILSETTPARRQPPCREGILGVGSGGSGGPREGLWEGG